MKTTITAAALAWANAAMPRPHVVSGTAALTTAAVRPDAGSGTGAPTSDPPV